MTDTAAASPANLGRRYPSEKFVFTDRITGILITALTNSPHANSKIYPTHPQWAADGRHIIFLSNRAGEPGQIFALDEITGEIVQLTDDPDTMAGTVNVARKSGKIYFLKRGKAGCRLVETTIDTLLADSKSGALAPASVYERQIMTLPAALRESGGFALDSHEDMAYLGVTRLEFDPVTGEENPGPEREPGDPLPNRPGGIRRIDLHTGEISAVIDVPFTMGHVQTNPWVSGEIIYCHETGGDAPQRIWSVRSDGTGNRPLYVETPDEWVTHEAVVDADHILFNIMGHLPRLRVKPAGIALLNLRTDEMRLLGQAPEERGFWHCNGSADGRWAAGDTFEGNIYLLDRLSGQMTLLTTDHKMRPDHAHPTFSPDGRRILFQSGLLTGSASLDIMTVTVPFALSPP